MKPTLGLINAQVINVKRFYVGQNIVVYMLLKNAKGISHDLAVTVGNKNGSVVIGNYFGQFAVGILFDVAFKNIGSTVMVNIQHLTQKVVYLWHIILRCTSNDHIKILIILKYKNVGDGAHDVPTLRIIMYINFIFNQKI